MTKIQRNDKCPCGSLKKYKICCINKKYNKYINGQLLHNVNITPIMQTLKNHLSDNYNIIDILSDKQDIN